MASDLFSPKNFHEWVKFSIIGGPSLSLMLTVSLFFFFFPFRYGVNDHILTHKLVQHAIQLPPSFDPIAPRKYNVIFLVSKEVCIPLFGICFVLWGFLLSALLVSTVAWWSPCWTSDWKVWFRVLLWLDDHLVGLQIERSGLESCFNHFSWGRHMLLFLSHPIH